MNDYTWIINNYCYEQENKKFVIFMINIFSDYFEKYTFLQKKSLAVFINGEKAMTTKISL